MNIIKSFIEKYGSQQKAAKILGVSQAAVGKWALGETRPSIDNAMIIAKDMNTTLEKVYESFADPKK